jgi:hypothetical protein
MRRALPVLLVLLTLPTTTPARRFAGLNVEGEYYSWAELGGWEGEYFWPVRSGFRLNLELEFPLGRGDYFLGLGYAADPKIWNSNRISVLGGGFLALGDDHRLRLALRVNMTYPYAHDWWGWADKVENAWWGIGVEGRWLWEFTPGLALCASLRPEVAWGNDILTIPFTAGAGLTMYF